MLDLFTAVADVLWKKQEEKTNLSLIVAYDRNKAIGKDNKLVWKQKEDLKRLQKLTTNQTIVYGRKTLDSIGKPLPNRVNRILTRSKKLPYDNIEIYSDSNKILDNITTEKIFIFGGESIYKQFLDDCDELYITEIDCDINGDAFFPEFNIKDWNIVSLEEYKADENNEYDYKFIHLKRKEKK